MTEMKKTITNVDDELRISKDKRSETNLHITTRSAVKQTKINVESRAEVPITKEVIHDEAENIKSSEGNFIQAEETNLRCQFCSNKYKTGKMLHRHMTAKHKGMQLCDLCKSRFTTKDELDDHILVIVICTRY